eukprot:1003-Chlamydomonas_euryale.AAC.3
MPGTPDARPVGRSLQQEQLHAATANFFASRWRKARFLAKGWAAEGPGVLGRAQGCGEVRV